MILHEEEICRRLGIPSIPKKEWDGKKSFKKGVAEIELITGETAYAVATFDSELEKKPHISMVFGLEPFGTVKKIYVVPPYMETDVELMDLDDDSKKAAAMVVEEVKELEESVEEVALDNGNEYFFDHITDDEQAAAYIRAYNKSMGIRGRVPTTHENLLMRLAAIYSETKKNKQ